MTKDTEANYKRCFFVSGAMKFEDTAYSKQDGVRIVDLRDPIRTYCPIALVFLPIRQPVYGRKTAGTNGAICVHRRRFFPHRRGDMQASAVLALSTISICRRVSVDRWNGEFNTRPCSSKNLPCSPGNVFPESRS